MTRIVLAALALACALSSPAFADVAAMTTGGVTVAPAGGVAALPYGDWIVAFGQIIWPVIGLLLTLILNSLKSQLLPFVGAFISDKLVESTVQKWVAYGEHATDGAFAGKTYDVNTGSAVLATAVNRATDRANASAMGAKLLKWAGGPEEAAAKIFRALHLDQTGNISILKDVQADLRAASAVAPAPAGPAKF